MSINFDKSIGPETSGKVSVANLTVSDRTQPADAGKDMTTDTATSRTDREKGGKGGEEGEPALPPSNAQFLASVIRDVAGDACAVICSKPGDPEKGGWEAERAGDVNAQCVSNRNNYVNCSSFLKHGEDAVQARKDSFSGYHILVLDDVGTKVERSKLVGFTPTYEIETSPGNYQVGIRLREPLRVIEDVTRLQNAVTAAGLCDKGASGVARWVRLPCAINGKAKHISNEGAAFACHITVWHPDVAYSPEEIVSALGLRLLTTQTSPSSAQTFGRASSQSGGWSNVFTPKPTENPVLTALRQRGLYKREISPGKHDVTCPWVNDHTDGLDSGAAYFEPDDDRATGGFVCQHSHRDQYHIAKLITFLNVAADAARGKARIDVIPAK